ncbi:MAG: Fic family protein [Candidatus Omnitrophota bacterium]
MFKPHYRTTSFLISILENMAAQTALIKNSGIKFPARVSLEKDAVNRSVHSSTSIEGNNLSLKQVAALSDRKDIDADQKQKQEVQNCLAALRWVLAHKHSAFTESQLLTLHKMMTKGLLPAAAIGRFRKTQNYVVNAKRIVIFTPPPPQQVARKVKELFLWLKNTPLEHSVIHSAIFHHEFVTIHPFTDGNGRVARAASQWILLKKKFDPVYTLGLDDYFAHDRNKYYAMIQQARDLDNDYTHWIEYVAQGLLVSIENIAGRIKEMKRVLKGKRIELTPKQEEILNLLNEHGAIGSAQISKAMDINRARVNQLVAPLVKAGIVTQEGKARGVKYALK